MPRLRTLLEWSAILIPVLIIGFFLVTVVFRLSRGLPSGLPGNGVSSQVPLAPTQQYSSPRRRSFTLRSGLCLYPCRKVVGRLAIMNHARRYIPIDLAVANGDLLTNNNLQFSP